MAWDEFLLLAVERMGLGVLGGVAGYQGSAWWQRRKWQRAADVELAAASQELFEWLEILKESLNKSADHGAPRSTGPANLAALFRPPPRELWKLQAILAGTNLIEGQLEILDRGAQLLPPEVRRPALHAALTGALSAFRTFRRASEMTINVEVAEQGQPHLMLAGQVTDHTWSLIKGSGEVFAGHLEVVLNELQAHLRHWDARSRPWWDLRRVRSS